MVSVSGVTEAFGGTRRQVGTANGGGRQLQMGRHARMVRRISALAVSLCVAALTICRPSQWAGVRSPQRTAGPAAWLGFGGGLTRARSPSRIQAHAAKGASKLPQGPSDVFIRCVEEYDPNGPHDFQEGPPPTGWRNMTETIRPYHPHPEWQIFPTGGFERDQKICSLYTLASGLYKETNKAMREDNEDGIRRHGAFIHQLREVLRFKVADICTPQGRKCRPFIGNVSRGLTVPASEVEKLADMYQVGDEFVWPAFTSCQVDLGGGNDLWPFDGNLNFEIECNIDPRELDVEEVYAPVKIGRFLQGSNEVLLPPMTKFRVIAEREVMTITENEEKKDIYSKILEVVELPTPPKSK